ncbi:MAG: nucleotidyltransferase domain-containing protein [Planctomycetaceae bacterium]|jgi:predicted nucleotidyltransferase|nr:nucleotidyltransferase domain-containing protein [Planctomycetaceae bacterium]
MRFGLPEETIAKINGVLAVHGTVQKAILYGSRAMETYRNGSDIDLTLTGNISFDELLQINTEIDDLMLPYHVDISCFDTLDNADLIAHIQRVGRIFYDNEQ